MGQPQPVATIGLAAQVPAVGFLEVLDRRGRVLQRIRLDDGTIQTLGRAYTNDVVVDDPYVCPHHARVHVDQDKHLVVQNLNSVNGVFGQGKKTRVERSLIGPNETFRIGHSVVRYRHTGVPLPKTLVDRSAGKLVSLFDKPLSVGVAIVLGVSLCGLDAVGAAFTQADVLAIAAAILATAVMLLAWAGVWAFATNITNDRAAFFSHAGIASAVLGGTLLAEVVAGHLLFGFDLDAAAPAVSLMTVGVIATAGLYLHLRFCCKARPAKLVAVAGAIVFSTIGVVSVYSQLDLEEFSADPGYSVLIKPAAFKLVEADSVAEFFDRSSALTMRLSSGLNQRQRQGSSD